MKSVKAEFPNVRSVKVLVEERRVEMEVGSANWRTHEYRGFGELPSVIRPAFASPGTEADLDLRPLVRQACASGKEEVRFEAPYTDGAGRESKTVLRSVVIRLYRAKSEK